MTNGHIDETVRNIRGNVGYAQPPLLFLNQGNAAFRDVASLAGSGFAQPRVGRGLACGDFDRDGDIDLLMTTNNGPAVLFRNDQIEWQPERAIQTDRHTVQSRRHRRDGADLHVGSTQSRVVRSGSSYLSQSELPVTFGVGKRDVIDRVTIAWPNGRAEEFTKVAAGKQDDCVEGKGSRRVRGSSQLPKPKVQLPTSGSRFHRELGLGSWALGVGSWELGVELVVPNYCARRIRPGTVAGWPTFPCLRMSPASEPCSPSAPSRPSRWPNWPTSFSTRPIR